MYAEFFRFLGIMPFKNTFPWFGKSLSQIYMTFYSLFAELFFQAQYHKNQPYDESLDVDNAEEVASIYTPSPATHREREALLGSATSLRNSPKIVPYHSPLGTVQNL